MPSASIAFQSLAPSLSGRAGTLPRIDGWEGCGGGQSSLSPISPASVTSARLRTSSYSQRSGPSRTWPRSNSPSAVNSGTALALTTGTPSSIAAATCRASCCAAPPISTSRLRAARAGHDLASLRSAARTAQSHSARISGFNFAAVAAAITSACASSQAGGAPTGLWRRADPGDQLIRQRANARVGKLDARGGVDRAAVERGDRVTQVQHPMPIGRQPELKLASEPGGVQASFRALCRGGHASVPRSR